MVEFEPYKDRYEVNYSLDKGKTYITEKVVEDPEEARSIGTRLRAEGKRYITIQQTLAEGGTLTDFKFKTDWELRAAIGTHIKLVMPDGTKRNAAFAIAELDSIIASHNEYTFSPSDNFPVDKNGQNINDRNYQDDKNAQAKVIDMAINFRPEDIVTDSRKVSGTPIVSAEGIVVSGNNRTMSLKRVKNDNPERYEEYVTEIEDRAINYGFEKIERSQDGSLLVVDSEGKSFEFKKPILVRIDFDFPEYNTLEMSKYNQATGKAERPVDVAIKLGKILNSNNECKEAVINIISNYETFSELYSNTADQKALSNIFIKYGILTTQAMPMYFVDNRFTDAGKDLIENMLAGLILEKDSLILSSEGRIKNYKQIIITSLPVLVKNASLGDDYSIIFELNKAIIIENKIGNLSFKDYLAQMDMFEQLPEKNVLLLNRLLSLGRNKFKASIEGYNNSAESNKEGDMFGEALTKQQIFDGHITNKIDADDLNLIDSALSNQSKLSVPEKEIKTEPIAMEKENTVVNAIDQNPFVGGNYFAQNPDKILAQVVTGNKSRWGKDIVEYKGTLDDIARIDAPENFIGANKENEPIATVINTPIKDVTDKDIDVLDSFKEALEKNKDSVTKKTTKKAKKALPTAIIDEVAGESTTLKEAFETLNPEISLEELRAFIWYKEKTGRPILNQDWINLSEPQADSRSTNEKIKDWVEAGILYYFDGELIPSFLYLSGNIYDKQNRLIAVENINAEDVEEMDSDEDDEEKEMEPTPKVSRSDSGADKDIIIERYGIDVYNRQVEALMNVFSTKYANRLVIKGGENTDGALVVLPNSKLAKNFKIKHTNTMPEFKWKQITAASHKNYGRPDFLNRPALMRDYHVFPELSLRDAFCLWLASGDVSVKSGINYADIIKIYIDGKNKPASSAQPDEEGRYVGAQLKVKQEEDATWERLKAKTKAEGDRLFNIFLDTELEMNDRVRLETTWNRQFNAIVNVNYNKVPVAFRSRRGEAVRPEKREAVAFTFASGSGLLAYDVGVGKTPSAVFTTSQFLDTGYAKRPLIIVPNQTYKQWFGEFKTFAPHIKLNGLYNLSDNYLDEVRDVNGKVQMVDEGTVTIITYEGLKQIGFNEETEVFLKNEVGEILMQVDRGEEKSNKKRDREFEKLNSQVEKLIGSALAKTKVNIEDLGFDFICMDEAHAAKKVFTAVKGEKEENLGNSEKETKARSQYQISSGVPSFTGIKSFMLTQYIQKNSGGGNTLLLTATPFTNSPLEIYSMLSMVGFHKLKSMRLNNLTTFFDTYVGISYELIINSRLRPERRQVIMGFNNLLSLQSLIRNFINYKTGEEVNVQRPNKIVIPLKSKIVDGVRISLPDEEQVNATIELTPLQKDLMDGVKSYADGKIDESTLCTLNFDFDEENEDAAKAEGVELSEDSLSNDEKTGVRLLKAMNHSRNLALSPYIFECSGLGTPTYKEYVETSNKLTYVIESIRTIKEYHEKEGTAMSGVVIYMDRGVHFFPLLREYLIREVGFEEHEVGIISSKLITPTPKGLPKDEAKEHVKNLFLGKIFNPTTMELETLPEEQRMKIVIGSSTIREGINLQAHSSVLFNCWLDWNPTDIQQLEGRIYRQGNKFKNVRIVNPLMIDSMDIFMFQKLEEKTSRINTIWESDGRTNVLKTEDFNPKELKMALIKDPAVLAELETIDDVDAIDNEIADIKNLIKRENKIIHSVNTIVNYAEKLHDFIEEYRPGKSKIDVNAKEFAPELIKNHLALAREIFTKQLDDEGKKIEAKWSRNPKKEAEGYYSNKHSYPPSKQYWFDELNLANLTLVRETNSYLVPSKLRVMDLPSHIKFLEEKVKEVESSKEKLTSEEALKIKTEYIIQQRLEKNIVEKPVFKLVDEFKRLNYLLSEVKPNLSANKQPNGPLLDEKGLARIDKEALEHLENIAKNEPDTKLLHTVEVIDADGNKQLVYTPERIKLHDEIIKDLTKDAVCISNDTPIAVLTGGAPGSGKSSFLKKYGEYLTSDKIFHIDADLVRERIPEYKGWNASATHQESRDVVNELIDTFDKPCKHDLLYDGTMSNAKKYIPLIKRIKGLGYKVFIVFMDIPKEVSVERALGRFQRGGAKGRYVPAEVIEDFYSTGKKGLDEIKNAVDGYMVVDSLTSNIIERGGIEMPKDRKYSAVFNGESGALPAEQIKVEKPTVEQLKARVMTIKKMIAKNPTPVLKARLKIVEKMLLTPEKFCCGGSINPYHGQEFKKGGPVEKSEGKFQLVVYAKDGSVRNAIVFKTKEAAEENAKTYTKMGLKYDIYPYELVYTKDGVPVNRRSNEHKDHVFYHEDGTKYKCLGYSEKLDDCVFQTIPEGTKVVGCVKGFYYNDPTKPKKFRDGGYVPEGEHANIYNNLIGERERVEFLSGNFREYSDSELSDMASLGYNSLPKKVKEVVAKWIENRHNSSLLQPYPEETYSLWNEYWTEGARKHFITDHFKGKKRSEYLKLINEPYSDLPSDLKLTIEKHRVEPKYANGGLFEAKQRYADNRNKENAKIKTLTEEQHSALSDLARVRHEFHSSIDTMVKNGDVFGKNETNLIIANIELQKSGLKKIPFIPIVDEGDIGYTSIDDNITPLDVLIETGEGLDGEDMPNEEENEVAYREWYEDNYHKIYEALDVWNGKIETYLKNIDKDHGTTYAPTGHARLKYNKGGSVPAKGFEKNVYNPNFDHDEKVRKMFSDMGFNDVKIKTVLTNGLSQYVSLKAKVLDEKKLYNDIFVFEDYPVDLIVRVSDHTSNLEKISGGVSGNTLSFEAFKKLVDNNIIEPIYRQGGSVDQKKVAKVMHEFKEHELKTHGKVVTNPKQAIAIALSEARKIE